jgi:hypothetical protein
MFLIGVKKKEDALAPPFWKLATALGSLLSVDLSSIHW